MLISSLALVGIGVTFLLKIFENPEPLQEMLRLGRYEKNIHFDILIGVTALQNNYTMVTANIKHLGRIPNLNIENWE